MSYFFEDLSNRIAVWELESEDLSNRIDVLELPSEDLSNRSAVPELQIEVWGVFGVRLGRVCGAYGTCLGYVWGVFGVRSG